jgi:hypothetical protein
MSGLRRSPSIGIDLDIQLLRGRSQRGTVLPEQRGYHDFAVRQIADVDHPVAAFGDLWPSHPPRICRDNEPQHRPHF